MVSAFSTLLHHLSQSLGYFLRFHFKLGNVKNTRCELTLTHLDETSYAAMWQGYWAVASTDGKVWSRCVVLHVLEGCPFILGIPLC
jgi:hypothetical protein